MITHDMRRQIKNHLGLDDQFNSNSFDVENIVEHEEYTQMLIFYEGSESDTIPAYLLIPNGEGPFPAVLIHHQHNSERHLGKSEVCGLAGNPLQAFGLQLVKRGFIVLAPDSICFEDRRKNAEGIIPDDNDFWQHYNEMCYRILRGSSLMKKVINDANIGFNILKSHEKVDKTRLGVVGHSYGGNTVLFQAAMNEDIQFACSSGAACTYNNKIDSGTGIEMAEVIPGFIEQYDVTDLVKCIAPRPLLLVSANDDKYSKDADVIDLQARPIFDELGFPNHLVHKRYCGGHALTTERFDYIIQWIMDIAR